MAGARKPMAVNMAVVGGKHWTKAELEKRAAEELHLPKPKELKPPKWLSPEARKLFKSYAKLLLAFPEGIVSELDTGTLGRYCDCELSYAEASAQKTAWLDKCRTLRRQYLEPPAEKDQKPGSKEGGQRRREPEVGGRGCGAKPEGGGTGTDGRKDRVTFQADWAGLDTDEVYQKAQKQVDYWSGQMARFEKICRSCAADMGLTVTSRCRLVVPQVELAPETDPLAELRDKFLGQVASNG